MASQKISEQTGRSVGAGILSWKSEETLRATLESHRRSGFLDLFDEITILFQEVRDRDIALAEEFGIDWIGSDKNRNIGGGFSELLRNSRTDYFFQLEDDLTLRGNLDRFRSTLIGAVSLIEDGAFDAFLCRRDDMIKAGYTKYFRFRNFDHEANEGFQAQFKNSNALSRLYNRLTNPRQAERLLHKAVWLERKPEQAFPEYFQKKEWNGRSYYVVSGVATRWANPALLAPRSFFEKFYSYAAANERDYLDHGRSLEDLMNRVYREWWKKQGVRLGFTKDVLIYHDRKSDGGKLNRAL
jgi:hypothetical protein